MSTVLMIVHSPPSESTDWTNVTSVDKVASHMARLKQLISRAAKNDLMIVFESINELDHARMKKLLCELGVDESRVRFISTFVVYEPNRFETELGIEPSRFIFAGHYRERCVADSMKFTRQAFPRAEIILLKGDYCISSANVRASISDVEKEFFKARARDLDIKRKPYRPKLLK